jgi:hypothetical protein
LPGAMEGSGPPAAAPEATAARTRARTGLRKECHPSARVHRLRRKPHRDRHGRRTAPLRNAIFGKAPRTKIRRNAPRRTGPPGAKSCTMGFEPAPELAP